ncbi:HSP-70 cofactor [Hartmannibacter diazotrophicus]|uniref:Protein GrpE n=1 Tax=Hartmannibacter diazotrophicus TaxID=1482074 RepID=A0A2C9DE04_9HYPH|nr:nucleotide exchange factor GrpE [Hartmannibacter diazotrophicus]SON58348.1 HSP-70 cofactor [Hartmannibacter diazotrophicus]
MTEDKRTENETLEGAAAEAPAARESAAPETPSADAQVAEMKEQLLRTLADMENLRRRTEREVKDARQYAVANFARDMLQVGDNLRRALDALPAEARAAADSALIALLEGVEMTERGMLSALEQHGVRKVSPLGEKFDPNFHQAMFEVPNPEVASGTVVQVVQDGYKIGDRVLRPAMVGVARGGPKAASSPANDMGPSEHVDKTV